MEQVDGNPMQLLNAIHFLIFVVLALGNVWAWRQHHFRLPRYVHWLAAVVFAMGCVMIWFLHTPGNFPRELLLPPILSGIVYVVFVLYGGAAAVAEGVSKTPEENAKPPSSQD